MVWATLVGSPNRKVKGAFSRCVGFGILTSDLKVAAVGGFIWFAWTLGPW